MHKHLQLSIIIGILVSNSIPAGAKPESSQGGSDKRRIAVALPKEPKAQQSVVARPALLAPSKPMLVPVPQAVPVTTAETDSPAGVSAVSVSSGSRQVGSNISGPAGLVSSLQNFAAKGFQRAEKLASSYDKRIALMIAWLGNSFLPSTTITPINSPAICSKQRHLRIADGLTRDQKRRAYLFN